MNHNRLSHAIAVALTGSALSVVPTSAAWAASTTMYNLFRANFAGYGPGGAPNVTPAVFTATSTTPCAPCANYYSNPIGPDNGAGYETDGWVWDANPNGFDGLDGRPAPTPFGHTQATADPNRPGWVGIGGSSTPTLATPFGYTSRHTLNWAVEMTGGGTAEVSNADAISRYTQSADIDAAAGAWLDNSTPNQGWTMDLDWGLFKSDVTGPVTLSVSGVNQTGTNYGFSIFQGMSRNISNSYSHHGSWNRGNNPSSQLVLGHRNQVTGAVETVISSLPGGQIRSGFTAADIVAHSVADNPLTGAYDPIDLNTITFNAVAGQIYSIAVGGYRDGNWSITTDGYKLTVSQVPVPAAVWLFGSALAGMGMIGRSKQKATA